MRWLLLVLLMTTSVFADVTRKQTVTSQFMGANEGTTIQYYAGDRQATESTMKWTSGMMKTMSGGKPVESGNIVRLDKQVVWSLNPKDKTYTEMTFEQFKEQLKKSTEELKKAQGDKPDTVNEELYEWKITKSETTDSKILHGWNCRNVLVEATGINKKDSLDKVIITINTWNSPDVPGSKEMLDFGQRYMKALGLDETALNPGLAQASMLYQKEIKAVIETSKNAPGEPVQSLFEIKHNQLKGPDVGKAVEEGAKEALMSKIPFGGKLKKQEPKKEEKPQYEMVVKYSATSELTEASTSNVDAAKFEVPAGYKLKK